MFTGLIEEVGRVAALKREGGAARLVVAATFPAADVALGDSIAVNGACLTVTAIGGGSFSFDVSPETLDRSTLGQLAPGAAVNLERALQLSDRLGGHIVTGHIDCTAQISARRDEAGNIVFAFRLPAEHVRYVVAKGSVAIDGISLTVNEVTGDVFSVNVIPHTASRTTLEKRRPGDVVNIETDILGKYVERLLTAGRETSGGVTLELLAKNGFL